MQLTIWEEPTQNFTKIPNDLIFHPVWRTNRASALYHIWCMLAALAPRQGIESLKHLSHILAQRLEGEYSRETLKKHVSKMIHLGLLVKTPEGWQLCLPEEAKTLPKPKVKPEPEPQKEIIEELREEPARARCSMSTADRWAAIRTAWNTYKPDNFAELKEKKDQLLFMALETHTRHLKIDRTQYGAFIKTVCAALKANDWWTKRPGMTARNVFGMGVEIEDRKLQNVQRLYFEAKEETSGFDHRNDDQIRAWYRKAMPENKKEAIDKATIHRITVKKGPHIPAIEAYCRLERYGENAACLNTEDEEYLEEFGPIDPAWHTGAAPIRVYYIEGRPDPTNWTFKHERDGLRNLPSAPIK